jgi:hypothetical protein
VTHRDTPGAEKPFIGETVGELHRDDVSGEHLVRLDGTESAVAG